LAERVDELLEEVAKKERDLEKLILDLKQQKIHVALLQEQADEREIELKREIEFLRGALTSSQSKAVPELNAHYSNTNVTCFNVGKTQVTNQHELVIDPTKFLANAARRATYNSGEPTFVK